MTFLCTFPVFLLLLRDAVYAEALFFFSAIDSIPRSKYSHSLSIKTITTSLEQQLTVNLIHFTHLLARMNFSAMKYPIYSLLLLLFSSLLGTTLLVTQLFFSSFLFTSTKYIILFIFFCIGK